MSDNNLENKPYYYAMRPGEESREVTIMGRFMESGENER
jgi:hypothetical protein